MKLYTYLDKFGLRERVERVALDETIDLEFWSFEINYRAKSRFGCCKYDKQLVEVTSEYYVHGGIKDGEMDDFINTLLHETAHAIVHERFGSRRLNGIKSHGREWKEIMRQLGAKTDRCGSSKVLKEKRKASINWHYSCKDCGYIYERQRRIKSLVGKYHGGCKRKINGGALIEARAI